MTAPLNSQPDVSSLPPAALRSGPRPLALHISQALRVCPDLFPGFLAGVRAYQTRPFERPPSAGEIVWHEGESSLRRFTTDAARGAPVLLIPSMINRSGILDLLPGQSFASYLAGRGYEVYLLEWGDLRGDPTLSSLDGAIGSRLDGVLRFLGRPVHGVGYCMGGLLLAAGATFTPERFVSLSFLATPWDFHAGERVLADTVKDWAPQLTPMILQSDYMPVDWIQALFLQVDPANAARKFSAFAEATDDAAIRKFIAVEDWLNDGLDLPAAIALTCIREWYLENATGRGQWSLRGVKIDPSVFADDTPTLIVASGKDRLVPPDSALALGHAIPHATVLNPSCGHIGLMAGDGAVEGVWTPIADWLDGVQGSICIS